MLCKVIVAPMATTGAISVPVITLMVIKPIELLRAPGPNHCKRKDI